MIFEKKGEFIWGNEVIPTSEFPEIIPSDETPIEPVTLFKKPPNDLEEVFNAADLIKDKYPRIFEKIELTWGSIELDSYFNKLIIDDRGNRNGFPKDVFNALLILAKANKKELPKQTDKDLWSTFNYK
jgi:hypothetical protein